MKHLHFRLITWLVLGLLWVSGLGAGATTFYLNNTNDGGSGSLRDLVEAQSGTGDTIIYNGSVPAVIDLTSGAIQINHSLTISGPGPSLLTISNRAAPGVNSRIFSCNAGTNTISGLTLCGGKILGVPGADLGRDCSTFPSTGVGAKVGGYGLGGAIYCQNGRLNLADCVFFGNTAAGGVGGNGNGIHYFCSLGDEGTLNGNGAQGGDARGGAIYCLNGVLDIIRCTFYSNSVAGGTGGGGGTIGFTGGLGGNSRGGAVFVEVGSAQFRNCTFFANLTTGGSGGVSYGAGGNGGDGAGGAIFLKNNSLTLINTTISGNLSVAGAGGISIIAAYPNGFAGNTYGGGIHIDAGGGGTASLKSTLVALNFSDIPDVGGTVLSQGYNLIGKRNGSSGWLGSDITGTAVTPVNPRLGPLQNNGGLTPTLELFADSPAIDAGQTGYATDQRGQSRIDFNIIPNNPGGDGSDIGAFEIQRLVMDIGLRAFDGTATNKIAGEYPAVSPVQITKNGTNFGVVLVPTNSPDASKFRIQTTSGTKALQKLP